MISFTQGDTPVLNLTAQTGAGNPFNLTGASFQTQIKGPNGVIATFDNGQHAITSAAGGTFTLTLASTDSANCGTGPGKDIITQVTQGSSITYFRGMGILTVFPNTPNQ
jgi:hypothetical protein